MPAGKRSSSIACGIDFLPTFARWPVWQTLPGVEIDGADISAVLKRGAASPHKALLLFNETDVVAVRTQRWKYVTRAYYHGFLVPIDGPDYPQLYDMSTNQSESYCAAERNPDALVLVKRLMDEARAKFGPMKALQQKMAVTSIIVPQAGKPKQD